MSITYKGVDIKAIYQRGGNIKLSNIKIGDLSMTFDNSPTDFEKNFPIEIKNNLIPDLIDFIYNNMNDSLENNIIRYLVDKNFKYNSVININQSFYSQNLFSIKRKNLSKNYVSKELNYLTRFLYEE